MVTFIVKIVDKFYTYNATNGDGEDSIRRHDRGNGLLIDVIWQNEAFAEALDGPGVAFLLLYAALNDHLPLVYRLHRHLTTVHEVLHVHDYLWGRKSKTRLHSDKQHPGKLTVCHTVLGYRRLSL